MDLAEWQKRLEDNFSVNGVIGGHLLNIIDLENACTQFFTSRFQESLWGTGEIRLAVILSFGCCFEFGLCLLPLGAHQLFSILGQTTDSMCCLRFVCGRSI